MRKFRVFIGYDPKQPLAYTVCQHSIVRHASEPVSITPLILSQLPIKRRGLTEFTYSRFLVPWLCDYEGVALFVDPDIVVTGDIVELFDRPVLDNAVVEVMHRQPTFEWASVMMFNCALCTMLTPEVIDDKTRPLFDFCWREDKAIGDLPDEWNHCVGYQEPKAAKLYHYTKGLPCWPETQGEDEDDVWFDEMEAAAHTCDWKELMGNSVHAPTTLKQYRERLMKKYADNE
jgi:hypothetical protein